MQIELVDHLALLIEEHWNEKPEDPFKYALYKAYQKFGSTGFNKVKEQKQKALTRKYNRILWHYLLEFYRWPKMLFTLAISLVLSLSFQELNCTYWVLASFIMIFLASMYIYDSRYASNQKIETTPGKSFLLLESLKKTKLVSILIGNSPLVLHAISKSVDYNVSNNIYISFIVAFFAVSSSIVIWGYFFYVPKKIKHDFMEEFGEFAV